MRKGFTLVEIFVVLAIVGIVAALFLILITSLNFEEENQAGLTSASSVRLEVVDGPLYVSGNRVFIIKDKQTEKEFVLVDGMKSVAISEVGK